jgi:hypothetical protein
MEPAEGWFRPKAAVQSGGGKRGVVAACDGV